MSSANARHLPELSPPSGATAGQRHRLCPRGVWQACCSLAARARSRYWGLLPPSPPGRGCVFLHPLEPQGNPAHSHGSPGPEVTAALRVLGRDAGHLAGLHPLPCPEGAQDTLLSSLGPRTACPPATIASIDHVPLMKPGPWFCWRHGVSVNTGRTGQLYFTSEFLTFSKCFTLIS